MPGFRESFSLPHPQHCPVILSGCSPAVVLAVGWGHLWVEMKVLGAEKSNPATDKEPPREHLPEGLRAPWSEEGFLHPLPLCRIPFRSREGPTFHLCKSESPHHHPTSAVILVSVHPQPPPRSMSSSGLRSCVSSGKLLCFCLHDPSQYNGRSVITIPLHSFPAVIFL